MKVLSEIPSNYTDILESFEYQILCKEDDDDYQGDSLVLFKKDMSNYGYLCFGWGSCSGCDSLQACESLTELNELQKELYGSIQWFKGKKEIKKFLDEHDWEGSYDARTETRKKFIDNCHQILGELE